jgi:hypothetical protein
MAVCCLLTALTPADFWSASPLPTALFERWARGGIGWL